MTRKNNKRTSTMTPDDANPDLEDVYSKLFVDKPFRKISDLTLTDHWTVPHRAQSYLSNLRDFKYSSQSNEVVIELDHYMNLAKDNMDIADDYTTDTSSCDSDIDIEEPLVNIHAIFGWSPGSEAKPPNDFVKNKFRHSLLMKLAPTLSH